MTNILAAATVHRDAFWWILVHSKITTQNMVCVNVRSHLLAPACTHWHPLTHWTHFARVRVCGRAKFRTFALPHTFPKNFWQKKTPAATQCTLHTLRTRAGVRNAARAAFWRSCVLEELCLEELRFIFDHGHILDFFQFFFANFVCVHARKHLCLAAGVIVQLYAKICQRLHAFEIWLRGKFWASPSLSIY